MSASENGKTHQQLVSELWDAVPPAFIGICIAVPLIFVMGILIFLGDYFGAAVSAFWAFVAYLALIRPWGAALAALQEHTDRSLSLQSQEPTL